MNRLPLTFETLATTRNEAAIEVLIASLNGADSNYRGFALRALVQRIEPRSQKLLLANWEKLRPDDLAVLRPHRKWLLETIVESLKSGGETIERTIDAAQSLGMVEAVGELVMLAESSGSRAVRARAGKAILALVDPIGREARADRSHATVRGPVIARLADSVRRFSMHRNEILVEAFLLVSTWGDGDLRQMIEEDGAAMELICDRFTKTENLGTIELLAGFIRRKSVSPKIMRRMQTRTDAAFRNAFLACVGTEPSGNVIRNLRDMGMAKSCHGGEELVAEVAPELRAALIHLYSIANRNTIETMQLITRVVRQGGPGCVAAAAIALGRCEIQSVEFWMRSAVPVADDDQELIATDENAKLLCDLIRLLEHNEPALVRGVQRVLGPLHADAMLQKFHSLRPRSRRRIGRVVMMIDPGAVERVRDALRHPVLEKRLEAIAMADALAIVDLLSDSFKHITIDDHQEARMKAAQVMADADGVETLKLLQGMVDLPPCPVRDVAVASLTRRQSTKTR